MQKLVNIKWIRGRIDNIRRISAIKKESNFLWKDAIGFSIRSGPQIWGDLMDGIPCSVEVDSQGFVRLGWPKGVGYGVKPKSNPVHVACWMAIKYNLHCVEFDKQQSCGKLGS